MGRELLRRVRESYPPGHRAGPGGLTYGARAVLELLALWADNATGEPRWPVSTPDLVGASKRSKSTVIRARIELEQRGLIEVTSRGTGHSKTGFRVLLATADNRAEPPVDNQAELPIEGCHDDTPGVSSRHPWGVKMTPLNARAREVLGVTRKDLPLTPTASGGGICPRATARRRPCTNCRACGTSRRAAAERDRRARAAAAAAERRARAEAAAAGPAPVYVDVRTAQPARSSPAHAALAAALEQRKAAGDGP